MKNLSVKPIYLLVFLINLIFIDACKKENSIEQQNLSGFKVDLSKEIDLWLQNQATSAGDSAIKNIQAIRKNLRFSGVKIEKFKENEKLIIVPLESNFKTETNNNNSEKYLILIQKQNGSFKRANVVEILASDKESETNTDETILAIYNGNAPKFDCLLSIYSIGSRLLYELKYNNKKIYSQKFLKSADNNTKESQCIDWYLVTYINGVEVSSVYLFSTGDCSSNGGCDPLAIQCGVDNSNGIQNELAVHVDSVKKEVTNPCLSSILSQITDPKLKSQVAKLFQETYLGWGGSVTVKFIEVNDLRDPDGFPQFASSFLTGQTWNINLNKTFTSYTSKEYMGVAILHEIIHSFIELYKNNTNVPLSQFDHHKIIFERWVNQLRDAMIEIYGMSSTDATALALQGLDDVLVKEIGPNQYAFEQQYNSFAIQKYGTSLYSARTIFDQYEAGTKGVKCQ